jgi:hypothetical protein
MVRDIEQRIVSTSAQHGATSAFNMGPSAVYTSLIYCAQFSIISAMISMFFMYVIATVASGNISHIYVVTNLLWFFWI